MKIMMKDTKGCVKQLARGTFFYNILLSRVITVEYYSKEGVYYLWPFKKSNKVLCLTTLKNKRKIGWYGLILLWIFLQDFLMIDHSWPTGRGKTLGRTYDLFLIMGLEVLIQGIPTYIPPLKLIIILIFTLFCFL